MYQQNALLPTLPLPGCERLCWRLQVSELDRLFIPILTLDGVEGSYPEMPRGEVSLLKFKEQGGEMCSFSEAEKTTDNSTDR